MAPHTTSLRITRRGRFVLSALLALPVLVVSLFLAAPGALADSDEVGDAHDYVSACGRHVVDDRGERRPRERPS